MKISVAVLGFISSAACAPWKEPIKMSSGQLSNDSVLSYYPADKSNGVGCIVLPGGGYAYTSMEKEGYAPVQWLNERGYDAWILDYATSNNSATPLYPKPQDQALHAIEKIRAEKAVKKLGIWGFSAGGHLAATTVTNSSAELDFAILAYPVITMDPKYTHKGSRTNLIGSDPSPGLQSTMSAENRVTTSTPPVFLFHTTNDKSVPIQNSLMFANAMASHGRKFHTLILPDGEHGLGLALNDPVRTWTGEVERFLKYSI